jgi:hypothetical protein
MTLADSINVGTSGVVRSLLVALLVAICIGIVYVMGRWFFTRPSVPPIIMLIWNGLFVLVGGIFLINVVMSLAGHPLIVW